MESEGNYVRLHSGGRVPSRARDDGEHRRRGCRQRSVLPRASRLDRESRSRATTSRARSTSDPMRLVMHGPTEGLRASGRAYTTTQCERRARQRTLGVCQAPQLNLHRVLPVYVRRLSPDCTRPHLKADIQGSRYRSRAPYRASLRAFPDSCGTVAAACRCAARRRIRR